MYKTFHRCLRERKMENSSTWVRLTYFICLPNIYHLLVHYGALTTIILKWVLSDVNKQLYPTYFFATFGKILLVGVILIFYIINIFLQGDLIIFHLEERCTVSQAHWWWNPMKVLILRWELWGQLHSYLIYFN